MNRILLLTLLLSVGHLGYSQCQSSVKVSEAKKMQSTGLGEIKIQVKASGSFTGKLILFNRLEEISIKEFSGQSGKTIIFDSLKSDVVYRVVVIFNQESEFLCHKKSTQDIILTDSK